MGYYGVAMKYSVRELRTLQVALRPHPAEDAPWHIGCNSPASMRVLISGAGIAGLTLALCLQRQGHEVLLIDKMPRLRSDGYMIDFFGPGYRAAELLGLLPRLQVLHQPVTHTTFLARDGAQRFTIPYSQLRTLTRGRFCNFLRGDLERLLSESLTGRVPIRFGTEVMSVKEDRGAVHVMLSDITTHSCDLLVGADGVHSRVRTLSFGPEQSFRRYLGCHAAACILERPPSLSAQDGTYFTISLPGRQAVIHPLRDGQVAVFFAHADPCSTYETVQFAIRSKLAKRYGDLGWHIPELLRRQSEGSYVYYDTASQIIMQAWTRGRIVLVGDACWCGSLLAGQGASLAMAGAYALSEELERERDIPAALSRYERRLRPLVELKQKEGRDFAGWFVPESALKCAARDLALRMTSFLSALPLHNYSLANSEAF